MLNGLLENKALPAAAERPMDLPSATAAHADIGSELARVEKALGKTDKEIAGVYAGGPGKLKELRQRRLDLESQRGGLMRELELAVEAIKVAEGNEAAAKLEQERKALEAKGLGLWKAAEEKMRAVAALYDELRAWNGERQAFNTRADAHRCKHDTGPAGINPTDLFRVREGWLGPFERAGKFLQSTAQHRDFLGDAPTEAEAMRRFNSRMYAEERERRERAAARNREQAPAPVKARSRWERLLPSRAVEDVRT